MFGDGRWAADSLLRLSREGHHVAAAVIRTVPSDDSVSDCARKLGAAILQPKSVNTPEFIESIRKFDADLGLSIAFNQIFRRPILETTRSGFVNFHAGKLPQYRGRNIINWAIINGEPEIGITAHLIDDGIDTGDIILQRTLPLGWTDTYGDVLARVVDNFPEFVVEAVQMIGSNEITARLQRHTAGTYFCGREDGDEWLDWSDSSLNLYNKIRAITRPACGARTLLGQKRVIVWKAAYDPAWPKYRATPGQIVGRRQDGLAVKTGDSTLVLQEIQVESGLCEVPSWPIGTRLGIDLFHTIQVLQARVSELEALLLNETGYVTNSSR
jgi:methionyl-tRNA formyltransferase